MSWFLDSVRTTYHVLFTRVLNLSATSHGVAAQCIDVSNSQADKSDEGSEEDNV